MSPFALLHLASIEGAQPTLIDGYAEALDLMAHFIRSRGGMSGRPLAVMSSARTLPEPSRLAS